VQYRLIPGGTEKNHKRTLGSIVTVQLRFESSTYKFQVGNTASYTLQRLTIFQTIQKFPSLHGTFNILTSYKSLPLEHKLHLIIPSMP